MISPLVSNLQAEVESLRIERGYLLTRISQLEAEAEGLREALVMAHQELDGVPRRE